MEQLIAREPAWRAAHEAARIARLMTRLGDPEVRLAALLHRERAWHAVQLEQARQQRTHATGREHVFANAVLVTGRLIDRVALVGDDFGRVLDRHGRMV